MKPNIIVVDDFHPNPEEIRQAALTAGYPEPEGGYTYPGRNSEKNYESAYNILMEYWDHFPDEEKAEIHKRLQGLGL